jgi:hypothetical protein
MCLGVVPAGQPPPTGMSPAVIIKTSLLLDGKGGMLRNTSIVVGGSRIARTTGYWIPRPPQRG